MSSKLTLHAEDGRVIEFEQHPGQHEGWVLTIDGEKIHPTDSKIASSVYVSLMEELGSLNMVLDFCNNLQNHREKFQPIIDKRPKH